MLPGEFFSLLNHGFLGFVGKLPCVETRIAAPGPGRSPRTPLAVATRGQCCHSLVAPRRLCGLPGRAAARAPSALRYYFLIYKAPFLSRTLLPSPAQLPQRARRSDRERGQQGPLYLEGGEGSAQVDARETWRIGPNGPRPTAGDPGQRRGREPALSAGAQARMRSHGVGVGGDQLGTSAIKTISPGPSPSGPELVLVLGPAYGRWSVGSKTCPTSFRDSVQETWGEPLRPESPRARGRKWNLCERS